MFTEVTDPKPRSNSQFRNYFNFCHKVNHSVSICFRKQGEDKQRKRNSYVRPKSTVKSFNHFF